MATANSPKKNARLEARITAEQKERIERAAAYEGRSVSEFVVATVQRAAKHVIQEHELLPLNEPKRIAGYYSLLSAAIALDELPADVVKKLPRSWPWKTTADRPGQRFDAGAFGWASNEFGSWFNPRRRTRLRPWRAVDVAQSLFHRNCPRDVASDVLAIGIPNPLVVIA